MKKYTTLNEIQTIARAKIRKGTFIWAESGAEDNYTRDKNINDLENIQIYPRLLNKIIKPKTSTTFFNHNFDNPFILCPFGHQTQFHKYGEIEMAKGTKKSEILTCFTTQGRTNLDAIMLKSKNKNIIWQFFLFGNKDWILKQIREAERNKCFALSICLDAPGRSYRYSDRETGYDARKFGKRTMEVSPAPEMALQYDFKIIEWIKSKTKLPIIPKGVMHPNDTKKLIDCGVDAIWLSNHGGRMFNSGISGVEILKDNANIIKKNKLPIIIDGGVRKGSDIIKYISLGANLVGIGRPAIYGLIANGKKGVENVIDILKEDLYCSMRNAGIKDLNSINQKILR